MMETKEGTLSKTLRDEIDLMVVDDPSFGTMVSYENPAEVHEWRLRWNRVLVVMDNWMLT